MKYILTIFLTLSTFFVYSQTSSSSDFQLRITFNDAISIENIQPYYQPRNGNSFEGISYSIDITTNSIILFGHNHYVLWVPFPVLVFTIIENIKLPYKKEKVERTFNFYLISKGPLSSYTGNQSTEIYFTYDKPIIVASLELHNRKNSLEDLKIEKWTELHDSQDWPLTNEMIKINKKSIK